MDTNRLRRVRSDTSGLLSLEASISLTIFIFMMLFVYSFLVVFEARNQMAHVLLTTADSLALDAFANETVDEKDESIQGVLYQLFSNYQDGNGTYTESTNWYAGSIADTQSVVEARFVAYLAGGDRNEADRILRSLNIVDGLNGLDFTGSKVDSGNIIIQVSYTVQYEFNAFGMKDLKMQQSACSKLWGFSGSNARPDREIGGGGAGGGGGGGSHGGGFRDGDSMDGQ